MSGFPPPGVAGEPPVAYQAVMNEQDVDALLAEFRSWLVQAQAAPANADAAPPAEAEGVDLHTLVAQFTGLRHEVNLQTRATRGQQEQNAETLRKLSETLTALESNQQAVEGKAEEAQTELQRPLLKTLVDVHDALALARREAQRVRDNVLPALEQIMTAAELFVSARPHPAGAGVFVRFLGAGKAVRHGQAAQVEADKQQAEQGVQAVERVCRLVNSLIDGYAMSLQRLERTLEQAGLEAIAVVGEPFDPEAMEVVEVVHEAGREGTEVVDEVRRGYLWQGRVFRFAQVRVARAAP
jgi:molecular chaperone GrpE